jgi:hypothetical protein
MAAGQGFKTFTTGEVLTAGDVNGYLMQGVLVFASAAARDAAITSPQEGQFAFTKDTNGLWYYDGAAWVASGATGDIEGVTAGIGISGGGTSGTVTVTNSMATAIDAKGDLVAGTGADTFAKLTVGANDTVLTADSTTATGLKWATPGGGGGMTLLATLTLSGSSTSSGTISSAYKQFVLWFKGIYFAAPQDLSIRLNGDTGSNYYSRSSVAASATPGAQVESYFGYAQTSARLFSADATSGDVNVANGIFTLMKPSDTDLVYMNGSAMRNNAGTLATWNTTMVYNSSAAITSVTILTGSTFSGGVVEIYGVN